MNLKETARFLWIFLGALYLFVVSPYFDGKSGFHLIWNVNIFQFVLAMLLQPFSCFILPGLFVVFSVLMHKRKWRVFFIIFVFLLEALNVLWFYKAWPYGLKFQGERFTIFIALINLLCFAAILLLAWLGGRCKNTIFLHIATLGFFIVLAFVAFPWLGESI